MKCILSLSFKMCFVGYLKIHLLTQVLFNPLYIQHMAHIIFLKK